MRESKKPRNNEYLNIIKMTLKISGKEQIGKSQPSIPAGGGNNLQGRMEDSPEQSSRVALE